MKKKILSIALTVFGTVLMFGQIGIGTTDPDASAALEVKSTTGGFLMPRINTSQRNAISAPANGLMVFNTETNSFNVYKNGSWQIYIGITNVQSDWDQTDTTKDDFIVNKPTTISEAQATAIATNSSAEQNVQSDWNQNDNTADDFIVNKPTTISEAQATAIATNSSAEQNVQSDWNQNDNTADDFIVNKPTTISEAQATAIATNSSAEQNVQSDWNQNDNTADDFIVNKPTTISEAQATAIATNSSAEQNVQSDWNQNDNTADDFIVNKPTTISEAQATAIANNISYTEAPVASENNKTTITLNNIGGERFVTSANSATNYTVSIAGSKAGAWAKILINAATEPTINGVSTGKIRGAMFSPNGDMYLVIYTDNGTDINYFFLEK
ncbi:hypothetical protein [Flavivirga spongiicola]|uniref:Uncharacterized protein n=1 Tax=Flavivirga spongiicola TaxID=421621 RepID=A0ABU7XZF8_9FLAO|nr:hypothetical protein [Flavivirga sp. MEBiC05379]MDO5980795.1 hypothetical protein [Flavivirga sp. MEBiC05379]